MLGDGPLHLDAIARLAPHLTAGNLDAVLSRAVHRSKDEIRELVAELSPGPDAPESIRRLPQPRPVPLGRSSASGSGMQDTHGGAGRDEASANGAERCPNRVPAAAIEPVRHRPGGVLAPGPGGRPAC